MRISLGIILQLYLLITQRGLVAHYEKVNSFAVAVSCIVVTVQGQTSSNFNVVQH
jgi:hypothetical protein